MIDSWWMIFAYIVFWNDEILILLPSTQVWNPYRSQSPLWANLSLLQYSRMIDSQKLMTRTSKKFWASRYFSKSSHFITLTSAHIVFISYPISFYSHNFSLSLLSSLVLVTHFHFLVTPIAVIWNNKGCFSKTGKCRTMPELSFMGKRGSRSCAYSWIQFLLQLSMWCC